MTGKPSLLIGMGDFKDYGGWRLDTQFMHQMGVPYLLAHGIGTPVLDAVAQVEFSETGLYYISVYTYDWTGPWKPELPKDQKPGRFQIKVGEETLPAVFGTEGTSWGWQEGGTVFIREKETTVALHDLTGFEGRCGLIYFSREKGDRLPAGAENVRRFYREMSGREDREEKEPYELVVCGGGISGMCAALSAARRGLRTALVQDRPVLGGNNSSEVRVWLGGETNFDPYPGIGNLVNELEQERTGHYGNTNTGEIYEDDRKEQLLREEEKITLYMGHVLTDVIGKGGRIDGVELYDVKQNQYCRIFGALFVDATGDGTLGYLSGADYEVTTNGHQGMTNMWYVEDTGAPTEFPECPWAIDLKGVDIPGRRGVKDVYGNEGEASLGCWFWESGNELDPIEKAEYARDTNFRAMYGAWDALKHEDGSYPNHRIGFAAYIGGKRESRRLFGDVVLTKCEVSKGVDYEDGCVPSTWNFDVHYPDKRFYEAFREGDGFLTKDYHEPFDRPYWIPYRCLYSRNVENLFMAGRDISVSHDALGTARVMRTGGMMGEVIGIAAQICRRHQILPRQVYTGYLQEFLQELRSIKKDMKKPLRSNIHPDN